MTYSEWCDLAFRNYWSPHTHHRSHTHASITDTDTTPSDNAVYHDSECPDSHDDDMRNVAALHAQYEECHESECHEDEE